MDRKEKLEMLQRLSENELTKTFLIPFYESEGMGCKNVRYTHRKLEFGMDIIYYKDDEYGNRNYTGVQVKKTRIMTRDVGNIFSQIHEAFAEPFTDLSDGKKKDLDRLVVLTSNEILEEAKDALFSSLRSTGLDKNVTFIDGNQLLAFLERYFPSAFWNEYDYFNKYFNAMRTDFEIITDISAIGQKEPVPLENIYVSLKLTETVKEREIPVEKDRKIIEDELIEKELERPAERARILDVERAINDYNKLVIVGAPGSGKTTLLKHLALKSCTENIKVLERTCVPIPITLRELSESGKDIREYIDDVFEKYDFPKAKEFVESDLKTGKCQLLLDGFDELATKEQQEQIAVLIHRFMNKYHKCQIVVTSRIAGYHDELSGFTKLELMEFDDTQIEKFIQYWFGESDPAKATSMQAAIKANEQLKALARNPLMIAIIAIIYEEDRELPQRRADLYNRCVEVLLSKWDVQKRLRNKYPIEKKEFILRKLAFYCHHNNKRVMTEKEVMQEMLLYLPQIALKKEDAKPFLGEMWQRSPLLRQISINSYAFLNLSFQEYFTALELKEQEDGISTIIQHLKEPWWKEPILLYAGISKDATALIKRIQKEVPEDMFYSNLMLFGKCVADAEFTEQSLRDTIVNELWSLYQTAEFSPLKEKAINVLALIKPDTIIDSLINDLAAKESDIRGRAADALGRIGSASAIGPLLNVLTSDKESDIRGRAADALGRIGSASAIGPLLNVLTSDKESDIRGRAADALETIGSGKIIEPLVIKLNVAKETDDRGSAAYALGRMGSEKAIEPLINAITTDKESDVRQKAAEALGSIGGERAIEPLINALIGDSDSAVRVSVAYALGSIGSMKAIEPLKKALINDAEKSVRVNAAYALGSLRSEKAIEPLTTALATDDASDVRKMAADALGCIGNQKAIKHLITALTSDDASDVREKAAYALGSIGSEKAIESLITALTADEEGDVRVSAAYALGRVGREKAVGPLIEMLKIVQEIDVQEGITEVLRSIKSEETIQSLIDVLKEDDEKDNFKLLIIDLLSNYSSTNVESALLEILANENEYIRSAAEEALYKFSSHDEEYKNRIKEKIADKKRIYELERLNKVKDEFLSDVSHELRTPLTPIITTLERMLDNRYGNINEKQREKLRKVLTNAEAERRLIENMLNLNLIESGKINLNLKTSNLKNIIEESIDRNREFAEKKKIEIQTEWNHDMKEMDFKFDVDKLVQVITNLLSNAIKFSFPNEIVKIRVKKRDKFAQISVEDHGISIKKAELEKIFDRYYQGDNNYQGNSLGVGLSIAKRYVDLHKGEIMVKNNKGKGATFTIEIPIRGV